MSGYSVRNDSKSKMSTLLFQRRLKFLNDLKSITLRLDPIPGL